MIVITVESTGITTKLSVLRSLRITPQFKNENVVVSGSPASVSDSQAHNEEDGIQLISSTSIQTLVSSIESVLLQTAVVPIQTRDGLKQFQLRYF